MFCFKRFAYQVRREICGVRRFFLKLHNVALNEDVLLCIEASAVLLACLQFHVLVYVPLAPRCEKAFII